jgi:Glyoxalase-like domain
MSLTPMPTRRSAMSLLVLAGTFTFWRRSMAASQTTMPAVDAVDHLLLGIRDLDAGIDWVAKRTGVKAVVGGSHPGRGTRNALIAFQGRRYLEIIAPDPAQPKATLMRNLRDLAEPRVIHWASASNDLDALAARLRQRGETVTGPSDGSRARPDGRMLSWRTLALPAVFERDGVNPVPFFIQWSKDSRHPSQDSPTGCNLIAFEIEHPNAGAVKAALAQVDIDAAVRQGTSCRLVATLDTPNGRVVLA